MPAVTPKSSKAAGVDKHGLVKCKNCRKFKRHAARKTTTVIDGNTTVRDGDEWTLTRRETVAPVLKPVEETSKQKMMTIYDAVRDQREVFESNMKQLYADVENAKKVKEEALKELEEHRKFIETTESELEEMIEQAKKIDEEIMEKRKTIREHRELLENADNMISKELARIAMYRDKLNKSSMMMLDYLCSFSEEDNAQDEE